MKTTLLLFAVAPILLATVSCGDQRMSSSNASKLQKEAQRYVDEVAPKIASKWDVRELVRCSSPELLQKAPLQKLEETFFPLMKLGEMKSHEGSQGQVYIVKSSGDGRALVSGEFTTRAEFENGRATISVNVVKNTKGWKILGFFVTPDTGPELSTPAPQDKTGSEGAAPPEPPPVAQLEDAVNKISEQEIVGLRREIWKVQAVAEYYEKNGDDEKAIYYYEKTLKADPADLPRQMSLAKLLIKNNRREEGMSRLQYVCRYAEDDQLIQTAEKILGSMGIAFPQPAPARQAPEDLQILLIPVGNPSPRIVSELRTALQDRMGMKVSVSNRKLELGKPDRDRGDLLIAQTYAKMQQNLNDLQREAVMNKHGLTPEALSQPDQQVRFIATTLEMSGAQGRTALEWFQSELKRLRESGGQYDMTRLSKELASIFPVSKDESIKCYLGVTSADVYIGDCANCYGSSLGVYGIVSTFQFTAEHNGDQQDRPRLLARTLKQALSTVNLILGMPRCNSPYCARSFPYTLAEHDAKLDELCDECKAQLRAYRSNPHSVPMAGAYVDLATVSNQRREWDNAIAFARKALENDPECGAAHERLCDSYSGKGMDAEAVASCKMAIKLTPYPMISRQHLATHYIRRAEYNKVIELYSDVIGGAAEDAGINEQLGIAYIQTRKWAEGARRFEITVRNRPNDALNQYRLGLCYYNLNRPAAAREALKKAIAVDPRISNGHYILGLSHARLKDTDAAIAEFRKELEINPSHFGSLVQLGRELESKGSLEECLSALQSAQALQPENAEVYNDIGYTYYLKKDYTPAIANFEKSLSLSPNTALTHYNKALAHYANHQYQEALTCYDKAAALGYSGSPKFRDMLNPYRKQAPAAGAGS